MLRPVLSEAVSWGPTVYIDNQSQTEAAYQTPGSSGLDLASLISFSLAPGDTFAFPTGVYLEMPSGIEAQVRSRSGLALKHSIAVLNSPGTIDSDYRGEIKVILHNYGKTAYTVQKGDRIAQLVFAPIIRPNFLPKKIKEMSNTERQDGGFGSTGK